MAGLNQSSRSQFEAPRLLLDLWIQVHDEHRFAQTLADWRGMWDQQDLSASLWAKAHLWWDEVTPADATVQSWPYFEEGAAIACLARWRLGEASNADVEAMTRYVKGGEDGRRCARVALAAALLGTGMVIQPALQIWPLRPIGPIKIK